MNNSNITRKIAGNTRCPVPPIPGHEARELSTGGGLSMKRRFTEDQIIGIRREQEAALLVLPPPSAQVEVHPHSANGSRGRVSHRPINPIKSGPRPIVTA